VVVCRRQQYESRKNYRLIESLPQGRWRRGRQDGRVADKFLLGTPQPTAN